jgi:Fuc2NAc and GlcNAc transferase
VNPVLFNISLGLGAAGLSWALTGAVRRFALARRIVDMPNARSSHAKATPRGGGLGLVLVFAAGSLILWLTGRMAPRLFYAFNGGLAVAAIGWLDDLRPISAKARLLVHFAAALWLVYWLPPAEYVRFGSALWAWGAAGPAVSLLGAVWLINSYNFMDGIDGLAGAEALTVALAGAAIFSRTGAEALTGPLILLAGVSLGFLGWNWPPAKIFMGDVSSGYLGYLMAVFWLAAAQAQPSALWWWPSLLGVFLVDATLTLLWRIKKRQKLSQAHRSHSYQYAARKYGHRPVAAAVVMINLLWLAPLAWAASGPDDSGRAGAICLGGLLPAAVLWILVRRSPEPGISGR